MGCLLALLTCSLVTVLVYIAKEHYHLAWMEKNLFCLTSLDDQGAQQVTCQLYYQVDDLVILVGCVLALWMIWKSRA